MHSGVLLFVASMKAGHLARFSSTASEGAEAKRKSIDLDVLTILSASNMMLGAVWNGSPYELLEPRIKGRN
jgi:hypothetical protein